MKGGAEMENMN